MLGLSAQGALYTFYGNGGAIPDYAAGQFTENLTTAIGSGYTITHVNVTINVNGGYNGDLYARLDYLPTGADKGSVVLLNRVGVDMPLEPYGYANAGFQNVTLDDNGAKGDIHLYGGDDIPTGQYQPDRRTADSLEVTSLGTRGPTFETAFNGQNANGIWTLTFSDWSAGDTSTLTNWSLNIEAVPEPVTTALIIFAGIFGCLQFVRYFRARRIASA